MGLLDKISRVLSNDLNKRIFGHSFWILAGNVISKLTLLIATILISRFLGKDEYGQFGIIKSTILMFAVFAGLELGITATKYISQYRETNKAKVEKIVGVSNVFAILISFLIAVLVFVFSKEIAVQIKAPNLFLGIRISSFILFFSSINGIQNGILAGIERFKELSINSTIAGILSSIALVISSKYYDINIMVLAFGLNYFICFFLNFFTLKKFFYSHFKVRIFDRRNFEEIEVLWKFSLPAILAGLMVGPVTWFCNYLLINENNGYEQMANFDIANQWRNTILFIPTALAQIALPLLSSNIENKSDYKIILYKNLKLNIYLAISLVSFFVLCSPIIVKFYGNKYSDSLIPLIIMFVTTGFITVNNVIGQVIASQGKMWLGFYVNFLWACILVIVCYLLVVIFSLGAMGICFAYLVSYIAHTFIQYIYIKKYL
ncbi:oligosaccharide flippase family protein [Sphingobacterium multivorum]|uniref:oligosaccharide flippase family protein n=1 Tax=Sphingobacterium multivorum TaxID=28454 RepID=UPI0028B0D324|nr:oligosaccharide flippase family protein [Sphingobacterium multivorum]